MATLTQEELEQWITTAATGKFHYTKVLDGQISPALHSQLRTMMHRCKEKGIAFPVDGRDGWWRPADTSLEEIRWWNGDEPEPDMLKLPLGINDYCYIPKPSLILVAGAYNTGKTAFMINVVNLNLEAFADNIFMFVSEGGELMRQRFSRLAVPMPIPPPFKMYRRFTNFVDIIEPDGLNVVDYLRVDMEKSYAIANELRDINAKLNNGYAVVAMQKPPGDRKLAFGGAATAFEPTVYVSIDKDGLRFEKIKVPKLMDIDPYRTRITFRIKHGVNFEDISTVVE